MKRTHGLVTAAALLQASSAYAAEAETKKWSPWIDFEAKYGNERTVKIFDAFAPVWQDNNSLIFANPRLRIDDQSSQEYNFGLGYRTLSDEWVYGFYGYVDRNISPSNNVFQQLTLGAEAGNIDWKFRTNLYQPFGTRVHAGAGGAGTLSGTGIQMVSSIERSLRGNDAEIGYRIPVHEAEDLRQFWVYAGGYHFEASGVQDITGPRLRVEYEIDDQKFSGNDIRLRLSGEIQHDDVRDTSGFIGLRIGFPLGKNTKSHTQLAALERRLADPVVRDIDIVTSASSTVEDAVNPDTGLAYDVTVIRAGDDVAAEVTAAGTDALIVFDGSLGDIAIPAPVTMLSGQTFLGAGSSIAIQGASSGALGSYRPTGTIAHLAGNYLNGGGDGLLMMADNSSILGLNISNVVNNVGSGRIIMVNNATNFLIDSNAITTTGTPFANQDKMVHIQGLSTGTVSNNFMYSDDNALSGIQLDNGIAGINVSMLNNRMEFSGFSILGIGNFANTGAFITRGNNITIGDVSSNAIYEALSTNSIIENNTIVMTNADASAIHLNQVNNLTMNNNSISSNYRGLTLQNSTNLSGAGNTYTGGGVACHVAVGGNTGSIEVNGVSCP